MDIDYLYTKVRKNFGKQCLFWDDGPKLVEDLKSDKSMMAKYLYKNPATKGTQYANMLSENQTNTTITEYADHGMNHLEGGWPKEVDLNDEEAVLRFRKKVERLNSYVSTMKNLTAPMEHAILQNNAVNIYEQYFVGKESAVSVEKTQCRIQNAFRDPHDSKRPITHCSWSAHGSEFAVSHCDMKYQKVFTENSNDSYIWDIENPNTPHMILEGKVPIVSLEFNPKDPYLLASGMYNGQVCHFDTRKGSEPTLYCTLESGHRDPVHSVLWITSKTGTEFFSASTDGFIKWWDSRKLDEPVEYIILDLNRSEDPNVIRSFSASCLEYDSSIPVRYMIGTENGYVISGNRKGSNQQEKLPWSMRSHFGPIYSIHRNQAFPKNFLTVGNWTARVWSEECKESAIIWTKYHKTRLTGGEWSSGRYSVFFLTREDGTLDLWDILQEQSQAILSFKVCQQPLTALRVRDDGELVVAANSHGTAYVVRYSANLAESTKNDKIFLAAMFDRETRREKLLENKNREMRFKMKELALAKESLEREEEEGLKGPDGQTVDSYRAKLEKMYCEAVRDTIKEFEKRKEEDLQDVKVELLSQESEPDSLKEEEEAPSPVLSIKSETNPEPSRDFGYGNG